MKLSQAGAEVYVPTNVVEEDALSRTTHLAIGAHQDDLEIMAIDGILACFQQPDAWFTGVVVTNGSGSARSGLYAEYSDEEMVVVRNNEQRKAADVGDYSAQFLLAHPSAHVKTSEDHGVVGDIRSILEATRPDVVYAHNLADKHDTHVGVTLRTVEALRSLKPEERPSTLYGCEVWRDLDWLVDSDKVAFDVSQHENLQAALVGVFDSQIAGGKRYDLATMGRRRANATYHESHGVDDTTGTAFAMDMSALLTDDGLDPQSFIEAYLERLKNDVADRAKRMMS